MLQCQQSEQRFRGRRGGPANQASGAHFAREPREGAVQHRAHGGRIRDVGRAQHSNPFAERPEAARRPVRHAFAAAPRVAIQPPARIHEIDELAVALLHRGHEREQPQRLGACARVAGYFVGAQIDDRRTSGVVQSRDSLVPVARWGADGTVVGRLRVERDNTNGFALYDCVQPKVTQMLERDIQWRR